MPEYQTASADDRWQAIEFMADALDGEPAAEVACLELARDSFPECDPLADWPGYAVHHLLEALLGNRREQRGEALREQVALRVLRATGINGERLLACLDRGGPDVHTL